jgi:hypothetical protein
MSLKAMVFIDGAWLYRNRSSIFRKLGEENGCEIDYAKLPRVFCEDVANYLDEDISLVRTNYFGTLPSARSSFSSSKQRSFYDFLEKSCGYEMEIHEVDVGGEGGHDDIWIKMALGASLMFNAAMPTAFDIAVLVGDDLDYAPVLRRARLLGRRIQLVSAYAADGAQPAIGTSLIWKSRVSDFPPIFIDNHAAEVRLVREILTRVCKQCGREEETTWAGPEFFCSSCRGRHGRVG